ncbi:MAG: toll/interleukin-1 receptor domain-containing protein [Lewinellaceae bacterium]|nr:toll/interleukin-1 receptor domain-containing protein [Lewinellaceae bacterium]
MDNPEVIRIFIAYSRKDAEFLDELKTFFWPLERNESVKIWYDGEIIPGQAWETEIKQALHTAEIFLLLVSANSLASDYFYNNEVGNALKRHHAGESVAVPVILKPCGWRETDLTSLQALPQNGKPVTLWGNKDEAYESIYEGLKSVIKNIQHEKKVKKEQEEKKQPEKAVNTAARPAEKERTAPVRPPEQAKPARRKVEPAKSPDKKKMNPAIFLLFLLVPIGIYVITRMGQKEKSPDFKTAVDPDKLRQDSGSAAETPDTTRLQTKSVETRPKKSNAIPASAEKKASSKNQEMPSAFEFGTFSEALSFVFDDAKNNFSNLKAGQNPSFGSNFYLTKVSVRGDFFQAPPDIYYEKDQWIYTDKDHWAFRFRTPWTLIGDQESIKKVFNTSDELIREMLVKKGIKFERKFRQWRTPDPEGSLIYLFPPFHIELNQVIGQDGFTDEIIICHDI